MDQLEKRPFGSLLLGPAQQGTRRLRVRVQTLLTVLLVSNNLIGAVLVVVLSAFVVPGPRPTSDTLLALAIAVPTYVVLAVVVGTVWGTTVTLRALHWALDDEAPTGPQRVATLRVPWRLTRMQVVLWFAATVLFTTLALVLQPARAVNTALTVAIAGLVVAAVAYLLTEFAMRPIAARALSGGADQPVRLSMRHRMVVFWCLGTGAPVAGLLVSGLLALTRGEVSMSRLAVVVISLAAIVLVFGLLVTTLNARAVVAPVLSVRDALEQVKGGDFDVALQVYDGSELGQLQSGFNEMAQGLRERERLRDLFGRHVGRDVAAAAAVRDIELGGETRVVSVLFVDLVGSTTYATEHSPVEVVEQLNRFFSVVVEEVSGREGLVNKFMGDAVLAVFGAPVEVDDHAGRALAAARRISARLKDEVSDLRAGVGVATGEVVAGNIGDESRFEYTVVGDAVNAAARLTELAKEVDGGVLAAWDTVESATGEEADHWSRHDTTTLRGRSSETVLAVPD